MDIKTILNNYNLDPNIMGKIIRQTPGGEKYLLIIILIELQELNKNLKALSTLKLQPKYNNNNTSTRGNYNKNNNQKSNNITRNTYNNQ